MLSTYVRDSLLNVYRGTNFPAAPANLYARLYNGDPGRDGTGGTDVTTSVRAAGAPAIASSGWGAITTPSVGRRQIQNIASLSYGNAVSSVNVTHVGLWDAATGGNFYGKIDCSFTTTAGQLTQIDAGQLTVALEFNSLYLADQLLGIFKGTNFVAAPSTLHLALYSDAGTTEITTSIRAAGRLAIASSVWSAPSASGSARRSNNGSLIQFGNSASTVTVAYLQIMSASSGGNSWGLIATPFAAVSGSPVAIAINGLILEYP